MSKHNNINESIHKNQLKTCDVSHCNNKRSYISKFCSKHSTRRWRYGHELHSKIVRGHYKEELKEVTTLVNTNLEHEGIAEGIRFFDTWLEDSSNNIQRQSRESLEYLHTQGVTGKDLLIEAAAFTLFGFDCNNWAVHDHHHFKYQLGARVLKFKSQKIYGSILKKTGDYIISNVGGLLITIKKAAESKEGLREKRQQSFNQPLNMDRSLDMEVQV